MGVPPWIHRSWPTKSLITWHATELSALLSGLQVSHESMDTKHPGVRGKRNERVVREGEYVVGKVYADLLVDRVSRATEGIIDDG